jgi:hypothetical protein
MKPWEGMELVLSHWEEERTLEPVCYTSVTFKEVNNLLILEIKEKGRVL